MDSTFQLAISSRRQDFTPPRDQSRSATTNSNKNLKSAKTMTDPQFINVTNSVSLDKSSRTQVRAQVMRDYHRRRAEKVNNRDTSDSVKPSTHSTLTAKDQTLKFRLGGKKGFRPWVPVKSSKRAKEKKGQEVAKVERQTGSKSTLEHPHRSQLGDQYNSIGFENYDSSAFGTVSLIEFDDTYGTQSFDDEFDHESIDQWLSSLDFSLQKSILNHSPASGVLDPFAAMSLLITPRTQVLLHYYFNVRLESSWLMMPMRKGLFSFAIHNTAMFHTFLTHYVASYNARFGVAADSSEGFYHRMMAIKLVNERLSDISQPLSDGTIAAVANLAAYECSNGSPESALVHLNGLEQLVNIRGGIHNGGFPPHVQRLLGWTDFHCANALLQKPRFQPLSIPVTEEPTFSSPTSPAAPSWSSPFQPSITPGASFSGGSIRSLFAGLRDLSATLQILRRKPNMPQEDIWYSDKMYNLQRQLFEILYSPWNPEAALDALCAIAGLMYCGHCLRDVPFTFESMVKAVTRLQISLESVKLTGINIFDPEFSEKMFWAVALGGVASEGKAERAWYVDRFRTACDNLGLIFWREAKELLAKYLWHPELDDGGFRLWTEAIENTPHILQHET